MENASLSESQGVTPLSATSDKRMLGEKKAKKRQRKADLCLVGVYSVPHVSFGASGVD